MLIANRKMDGDEEILIAIKNRTVVFYRVALTVLALTYSSELYAFETEVPTTPAIQSEESATKTPTSLEEEKPTEIYGNTYLFIGITGPYPFIKTGITPFNFLKIELVRLRWEYFQISLAKYSSRSFKDVDSFFKFPEILKMNFCAGGVGAKFHLTKYAEFGFIGYPLSIGFADIYMDGKDFPDLFELFHTTYYFRVNYKGFSAEIGMDLPLVSLYQIYHPIFYFGFGY